MTIIYDSTNASDIPLSAAMVAGYVDGIYAWSAADWQRFAGKPQWKIAIFYGTDNGNVLDVEQYDATPAQAPVWVKKRLASGAAAPLIIYCNRGNRSAVESALAAAGVTASQAALWVATLDGTQSVPAGPYPVIAVQYANSTLAGGHYDLSILTEFGAASGSVTGAPDLTADQSQKLDFIYNLLIQGLLQNPPHDLLAQMQAHFATLEAEMAALKAQIAAIPAPAAASPEPKTLTIAGPITGTLS